MDAKIQLVKNCPTINRLRKLFNPIGQLAMSCRPVSFLWLIACVLVAGTLNAQSNADSHPIFGTGVPNPTQDKPQSKLWFAHGRYWAWLPVPNGSTVLEQTATGWEELLHLRKFLAGLPGQADVWSDEQIVRSVLVGGDRLAVVEIKYDVERKTYVPSSLRHEFSLPPLGSSPDQLETATIARGSDNRWWIAFDRDQKIFAVRTSDREGQDWSDFQLIGANIYRDDISALFALKDRVGVIWSDQVADAVYFREHLDGRPPEDWSPPIVVEQGKKTADDHLSGVVAEDGTLFVATKNSVDVIGKPQLVLRIRRPDGRWENHPYADLHEKLGPSRPIVQLAGAAQDLILLHTNYDRRDAKARKDHIAGIRSTRQPLDILRSDARVLTAAKPINNVTGMKRPLRMSKPLLVLASDAEGNVYSTALTGLADQ